MLHRLPSPTPDEGRDNLIRFAAKTASFYKEGEMVGCVVVAWAKDGYYNTSYYFSKDSPYGHGMLPSFLADALRRRMIEEGEW
jgi:hypothetical protein